MVIDHFADTGYSAGSQCLDRPGRNRIHANVLRTEVVRQIADGGFQRGLGHTHDIVVRHDTLCAEIGQRDDRPAIGHKRQRGACDGNEGIGADVQGRRKTLTRGVHKLSREFLARGKGNGVDEEIERADFFAHVLHHGRNLLIIASITGKRHCAGHRRDEFFHILPQSFILVVEHERRALAGGRLGDGPGNAVLVGDADNEPFFAIQ